LQKIYRLAGHDVVSINYLGDWGVQLSMLIAYWSMKNKSCVEGWPDDEQWKRMPSRERIEFLTKIYVEVNF